MLKILELFGGIGACSKALERLGIDFEIADYVEIDKYAVKSFNAIHGTGFEPQDICEWDKDIEVDLIMHGSPCQDFSIAGLQSGGDEKSGTRSSLLYETVRIVSKLRPKYVVWENVKNVLSQKHVHNFQNYLDRMDDLGYQNYYEVLNAKDYGIPQNRERVFVVSVRKDIDKRFSFPKRMQLDVSWKDLLQTESIPKNVILSELDLEKVSNFNRGRYRFGGAIIKNQKIYNTITSMYSKTGGNSMKIPVFGQNNYRILTPKECWRLMGFDDEDFAKAEKVNSNTQLYKQAGNSIVVNVLEAILKNLLTDDVELPEGQMEIYDFI